MARVTIELEMDTNLVLLSDIIVQIKKEAEDGTLDYTVELDEC